MFKEILFSKPRTVQKRITASGWVLKATTAALKTVIHIGRVNIQWISMQLLWTLPKPGMECTICKTESLNTAVDVAWKKSRCLTEHFLRLHDGKVLLLFFLFFFVFSDQHCNSAIKTHKEVIKWHKTEIIWLGQTNVQIQYMAAFYYQQTDAQSVCVPIRMLVRTIACKCHLSCR